MNGMGGAFAIWHGTKGPDAEGCWADPQASVFSMFGADTGEDAVDEYLAVWPRAGAVREQRAVAHESAHEPPRADERLWPTPAASLPNDGEEPAQWLRRFIRNATKEKGATRAGVPLAVAARAPIVLLVARINRVPEANEILKRHEDDPDSELSSREMLNPQWVEHLMGFPPKWTEL